MAKDRERVCQYYECGGKCKKGSAGTFRDACQTCNKYKPLKGARPKRTDNRKKKLEKISKKERWDY